MLVQAVQRFKGTRPEIKSHQNVFLISTWIVIALNRAAILNRRSSIWKGFKIQNLDLRQFLMAACIQPASAKF
jgi:hypothetical protein